MAMRSLSIGVVALFIFLSGCKKDEGGTGPGGGVGQVITVNGFVKDQNGEPVGGKPVIVTGKNAVISTSNGSFSIPDVTTPYDITVIAVIGALKIAVVYNDLTRPDPVLAYPGGPTGIQKNATISGTVPAAPTSTTRVFFTSGDRIWSATAGPTGPYSIFPSWYGPDTTLQGQLHVLRYPSTPAIPTNYDAYGSRSLTISNELDTVNNNFLSGDLNDPSEQSISGTITHPSNYTLSNRQYYIAFGGAFLSIAGESSPADVFSFAAPSISGATFPVWVEASGSPSGYSESWKTGLTPNTSGVTITVDTSARPVLPINNATNVENPEFQWAEGSGGGVNFVYIYDGFGQPEFQIYTAAANVRIPDLSSQGFGLPPGTSYSWYVERHLPLGSVNDVASDGYRRLTDYNAGDYRRTVSETFNFTTRP